MLLVSDKDEFLKLVVIGAMTKTVLPSLSILYSVNTSSSTMLHAINRTLPFLAEAGELENSLVRDSDEAYKKILDFANKSFALVTRALFGSGEIITILHQ